MLRWIVLSIIFWGMSPTMAFGNGVAIEETPGNTVIPVQHHEIRLLKEVVTVKGQQVIAVFTYENLSTLKISLQMGFPLIKGSVSNNFIVLIDGKESQITKKNATENVRLKIGGEYEFMYIWSVDFEPKEKKIIECRYPVQWGDDLGLSGSFSYIAKTGALWKGSIEQANISVELDKETSRKLHSKEYAFSISPIGYKIKRKKIIEWHFSNWTPKEDILISYHRILRDEDPAVIEEIIGLFQFKKQYEGNRRYYTFEDLEDKRVAADDIHDRFYVKVLRNEIFARHGRTFKLKNLQRVFINQSWYKPSPNYSDKLLNEYERRNIEFILEYEKKKGWR